ncbi:histidine kinase [Beutenbergia cavernae DSM 12333]|uniref:histidine kinase n=1 Tax=Beutenbergia cavernae (strain ATCC BAA-8 / DSM 12333 / CCUG 43141 / JCM 11478 / NBRC 16432 / NCIMB 13614 / HKI 0122) TaxID=471853 RepID=C5BY54_BEUC1|nr:histidine kinase [Beutenbergia cavernae]ACQ80954.1 histidine kinase [Beutenbergia cavernae DSM 12333]
MASDRPRSPLLEDAGIALAAGAVWFGAIALLTTSEIWNPRWLSAYWWTGAWIVVALALRRVAPGPLFWITVVGYPLVQRTGLQSYFVVLPLMVVAFAATRAGAVQPALAAITGAASSAALLFVGGFVPLTGGLTWFGRPWFSGSPSEVVTLAALVGGSAVLGTVIRRLDLTTQSLRESNAELRALHAMRARQAVAAERTRIARELHDVVAHHLTAIVVRAQAADRVAAHQPAAPSEAVRWIAQEGGTALTAMRSVVRVLRDDAPAPAVPAPSLHAVVATADRMRAAGHTVDLTLPAEPRSLAPEIELAVVRIVQEGLTNVLLHSRAETSVVVVDDAGTHVDVTVRDPGPARPAGPDEGGGHGIAGMRERVEALGGSFAAGPDGDGWVVHARLGGAAS